VSDALAAEKFFPSFLMRYPSKMLSPGRFSPSQNVFGRELISPDFRWGFSRQARRSLEIKMRLSWKEYLERSRGAIWMVFTYTSGEPTTPDLFMDMVRCWIEDRALPGVLRTQR